MIDEAEIREAIKKAGIKMSNKQLNHLFENLDNNENNKIDYTEFIMSTIDLDKFLTEDKINAIFNCFDLDHSGSLNFLSIKNAFTKFGKEISDDEVN